MSRHSYLSRPSYPTSTKPSSGYLSSGYSSSRPISGYDIPSYRGVSSIPSYSGVSSINFSPSLSQSFSLGYPSSTLGGYTPSVSRSNTYGPSQYTTPPYGLSYGSSSYGTTPYSYINPPVRSTPLKPSQYNTPYLISTSTGIKLSKLPGRSSKSSERNSDAGYAGSLNSDRSRSSRSAGGDITSSSAPSSRAETPKSSRSNSINSDTDELDYKKVALYAECLHDNELLQDQLKKTEDELTQACNQLDNAVKDSSQLIDHRSLERKLSAIETELKNLQLLKSENERLRSENRKLTRVITTMNFSAGTDKNNQDLFSINNNNPTTSVL